MLSWVATNFVALGALGTAFGAVITFGWSAVQFVLVRRQEQRRHDFEMFHRLIKELVTPEEATQVTRVDRQVAVVFELRHFPRYYNVSARILSHLRAAWSADPASRSPYLLREIDLAITYIQLRHGAE